MWWRDRRLFSVLTVTELLARVSTLGALRLLYVIRWPSTTTTQSVRLIVTFTKTRSTFRLETQQNYRLLICGTRFRNPTIAIGGPSAERQNNGLKVNAKDRSNKSGCKYNKNLDLPLFRGRDPKMTTTTNHYNWSGKWTS